MGLTGKFKFRKTLWGKIVMQLEEEVKPFWSRSKPEARKRRWRDATLMDLADPQMRFLIDMRFKPHLWARSSLGFEATSAFREPHETNGAGEMGASRLNGEARRRFEPGQQPIRQSPLGLAPDDEQTSSG